MKRVNVASSVQHPWSHFLL